MNRVLRGVGDDFNACRVAEEIGGVLEPRVQIINRAAENLFPILEHVNRLTFDRAVDF